MIVQAQCAAVGANDMSSVGANMNGHVRMSILGALVDKSLRDVWSPSYVKYDQSIKYIPGRQASFSALSLSVDSDTSRDKDMAGSSRFDTRLSSALRALQAIQEGTAFSCLIQPLFATISALILSIIDLESG